MELQSQMGHKGLNELFLTFEKQEIPNFLGRKKKEKGLCQIFDSWT